MFFFSCVDIISELADNVWIVNIVCGLLSGLMVWWITLRTADIRQRRLLRGTLNAIYDRFRLDVVRAFLEAEFACLSWDETKELCKPENFRKRYYATSHNYGEVQNGMDDGIMRRKMSRLFNDFGLTIRQSVISTDVVDAKVTEKLLAVANELSDQAFEFEHTGKIDNPVDYAYGLIAQWNMMTGYLDNDFIRDRINAI